MLYETQRKSALALDLSEAGGGLVVAVPAAELAVGVAALEQQAVRGQDLRPGLLLWRGENRAQVI